MNPFKDFADMFKEDVRPFAEWICRTLRQTQSPWQVASTLRGKVRLKNASTKEIHVKAYDYRIEVNGIEYPFNRTERIQITEALRYRFEENAVQGIKQISGY